jgi:hypothetical protein
MAEGWAIPWETETGETITLHWAGISSLTASRLRRAKNWYGPDYGKAYTSNLLFLQGDVDAVACVIWECLHDLSKEPGSKVRCPENPNMLPDFSVGGVVSETVHTPDPTPEVEETVSPPIPDSTEILTNSEEVPSGRARSSGSRRRS